MGGDILSASAWLASGGSDEPLVDGAQLIGLKHVVEARGHLTVGECGAGLPFVPRRFFVISRVPGAHIRGEHAHRRLREMLVCLSGSVVAEVDDGKRRRAVLLDSEEAGLVLGPMVWVSQHDYTADAVLLVLASHEYDPADYIREYARFVALRAGR